MAQKAKLRAELAEQEQALQDSYYDRSISDQQDTLDKELEDFKNQQDTKIEDLEEYLNNVEQVVADSLLTVQANASTIYDTLNSKADEYNLTLSNSILTPWQDGAFAITEYQEVFDTAASSTWDQLESIKQQWQDIIDKMAKAGTINVDSINAENAKYAAAEKTPPKPVTQTSKPATKTETKKAAPSLTEGSYVEVKPGTKWYANSYGGGFWGYASSGTIKYINSAGSHAYNINGSGWIKKTDIVGYAKGSKGVKGDQLAWIDELGDELQLIPGQNGRLEYIKKGTGIIPADLTQRLIDIAMNPQDMIDRNRPSIAAPSSIINNTTEIKIDASVGELVHVEHLDGNNLEEITKVIDKAWDKKIQGLNNSIRKFAR